MRTLGIAPGDAVLVLEHRGEQQIVYHALVAGISMRGELRGTAGEPAIEAAFVAERAGSKTELDWWHPVLSVPGVVHLSHVDWLEGRAGLAYEELPAPLGGVCRYCRCTERRACAGGCSWLDAEFTVCSAAACEARWLKDNLCRMEAR